MAEPEGIKKQIRLNVYLDKDKQPQKLTWDADDNQGDLIKAVSAIHLGMWDKENNELIHFELWEKNMLVNDMKMLQINLLGALAENMRKSTGDQFMADETDALAEKLFLYFKNTIKKQK